MQSEGSEKKRCVAPVIMPWKKRKIVDLIRAIKKQDSLWNLKSKSFKDKNKKALAWEAVAQDVGKEVNACKKKMESLWASFRREKCRIRRSEKNESPEDVYVPKWAFWNEMNFIRGLPDVESVIVSSDSDDEEAPPRWSPSARRPVRKRKKKLMLQTSNMKSDDSEEIKFAKAPKIDDEHDTFGKTIATKLRKMDETQRLYAENIINQALYKGLTFQLTVQSDVELLQPKIIHSESYSHYQQPQQSPMYFQNPAPVLPAPYIQKTTQNRVIEVLEEPPEDFKETNML